MRRQDRAVTQIADQEVIIKACRVCRLAFCSNHGAPPYLVPMNFGYTLEDGRLTLYFHSATKGRKLTLLESNPHVGFEMDCDHAEISGEIACDYSFAYASIIGSGTVVLANNDSEKRYGLTRLMQQITGSTQDWTFDPHILSNTCVFKVEADEWTAKRQRIPGRPHTE